MEVMTAHDRVLAGFAFQAPDRVPRFESFWEYPDAWHRRFGPAELLTDMEIRVPDEAAFPTRARLLREEGGWVYEINPWGALIRRRPEGNVQYRHARERTRGENQGRGPPDP